jgi:hypothetical protein
MQGGSEYEPEPEPQPDTRSPASPMQRAPVAAKKDGPDLLQQLQVKQLERVQLSVQFLTTPAVRTQNKRKKLDYLKKQLHVSDAEAEEAHKRAQDALLQPALAFLQSPQVVPQPIDRKVGYIRQKLGLHDCDIEEAFRRTGDTKSGLYFRTSRISQAVKFLTNPALKNRPGDAKVKYLKNEFGMDDGEVKVRPRVPQSSPRVATRLQSHSRRV